MSGPLSPVAAAALSERLAARVIVVEQSLVTAGLLPDLASAKNAFDQPVEVRVVTDVGEALRALPARGAAFLSVRALVDARAAFCDLVDARRAAVVHAVLGGTARDVLDAHAALDLGGPALFSGDAQHAADLAVVAHRLAEDAEVPVLVVHEADVPAGEVAASDAALVRGVLEPAPPPLGAGAEGLRHRVAAERTPFALSSALRAFERFAGRKQEVVRGHRLVGADIAIVAAGGVARAARAAIAARGEAEGQLPVGLLEVVALRPFPGQEIVKALSRARAVAVVERADTPLAQSSSLAVAVKAAFADALTWTPGYPGIGRVPTLFSACIDPHPAPRDLLRVIERIHEGDLAPRSFVVERA